MADPVSILAIAALVYAGKKLSVESKPPTVAKPIDMGEGQQNELAPNPVQQVYEEPDRVPEWAPQEDESFKVGLIPKRELANFGEIAPQGRSSGAEILGMRDRVQYDTGRMNNLAPIEKVQVGPGLGVDASVPAIGGHQQLFRVNPINVNEHRLTQLEGRANHGVRVKSEVSVPSVTIPFTRTDRKRRNSCPIVSRPSAVARLSPPTPPTAHQGCSTDKPRRDGHSRR